MDTLSDGGSEDAEPDGFVDVCARRGYHRIECELTPQGVSHGKCVCCDCGLQTS